MSISRVEAMDLFLGIILAVILAPFITPFLILIGCSGVWMFFPFFPVVWGVSYVRYERRVRYVTQYHPPRLAKAMPTEWTQKALGWTRDKKRVSLALHIQIDEPMRSRETHRSMKNGLQLVMIHDIKENDLEVLQTMQPSTDTIAFMNGHITYPHKVINARYECTKL